MSKASFVDHQGTIGDDDAVFSDREVAGNRSSRGGHLFVSHSTESLNIKSTINAHQKSMSFIFVRDL